MSSKREFEEGALDDAENSTASPKSKVQRLDSSLSLSSSSSGSDSSSSASSSSSSSSSGESENDDVTAGLKDPIDLFDVNGDFDMSNNSTRQLDSYVQSATMDLNTPDIDVDAELIAAAAESSARENEILGPIDRDRPMSPLSSLVRSLDDPLPPQEIEQPPLPPEVEDKPPQPAVPEPALPEPPRVDDVQNVEEMETSPGNEDQRNSIKRKGVFDDQKATGEAEEGDGWESMDEKELYDLLESDFKSDEKQNGAEKPQEPVIEHYEKTKVCFYPLKIGS